MSAEPHGSPVDTTPVIVAARRTPVGTAGKGLARCDVVDLAAPVLRALADDLTEVGADTPTGGASPTVSEHAVSGDGHNSTSGLGGAGAARSGDRPGRGASAVASVLGVGAPPTAGLLTNPGFTPHPSGTPVHDVILGNTMGPGGNPARSAALRAGFDAPALTVDRQCGAGLEAINLAAAQVRCGAQLVFAGGVESASTAPWRMRRPTSPTDPPELYERALFSPREIGDPGMGEAAENVARALGIDRARQDAYAARSHALTLDSAEKGVFDAELVVVPGARISADERPRRLTEATLARLRPAFVPGGTVTAGNSCGVSDGAAAVALVPERVRRAAGVPGLTMRAWATVGGDPRLPGACAAPAVLAALRHAGLDVADVGAFEITEAFAAQLLAAVDELGLDPLGADSDRVCAQGGAIALGHPWGASGALLVVRLFARMVRADGPRFGVAACAIGGGQGVAAVFERVG